MLATLSFLIDALALAIGYAIMLMAFSAAVVYFDYKFLMWAIKRG